MTTLNLSLQQVCHVAELLLGAAHADDDFDGHEAEAIGDILRSLVPGGELPVEVTRHLASFDLDEFDAEATCSHFAQLDEAARQGILSLVVKVTEADGVHDLSESDYIHRIAEAFGVDQTHYSQFTVDIIEIEHTPPPPLPPQV